jgi:hypothetical protein
MEWASVGMVRDSTLSKLQDEIWLQIYDRWSLIIEVTRRCFVMSCRWELCMMCDLSCGRNKKLNHILNTILLTFRQTLLMKSKQGTESRSIHDSPDISSNSARRFLNSLFPFCATLEAQESFFASCKGRGSNNNCRSLEIKYKDRLQWQGKYHHQHDYSRGSALANREMSKERNR